MAGGNPKHDLAKALQYKEEGNKFFQRGDFASAEALYTKGIHSDPNNPQLYTNRANALLSLCKQADFQPAAAGLPPTPIQIENYDQVISDCLNSIRLSASNLKAHYFLAQAQIALHQTSAAVSSATEAHRLCIEEVVKGGKGGSNFGPITELVLRCKKEEWDARETERLRRQKGLTRDLEVLLEEKHKMQYKELEDKALAGLLGEDKLAGEKARLEDEFRRKVEDIRQMAVAAGLIGEEAKRRVVPDWCLDDITFSIMVDPVVTKTGQSYDRSSIMEHLKRSQTDPLTRAPLRVEDLRPNLALKEACENFLKENGWAVDW